MLLLAAGAEAAYGTGAINGRERAELRKSFARLAADEIPLGDYLRELRYLGLVPGWGTQGLRLHFSEAMEKLGEIEPLAELFIQDQLRGSPLLFYSQVLDDLSRDANRLAGAQHKLFGRDIGAGFNALNPGLARGVLHANPDMKRLEDFRPDGIYVLPESVADLPPLAGHPHGRRGQPALARAAPRAQPRHPERRGGPVAAARAAPERRQAHRARGEPVGPGRRSPRTARSGTRCSARRRRRTRTSMFEPDLKKLDLSERDFVSLDALRAKDSGRIVGPKAAKLGELKAHFPDRVAPGVGIPFGLYRATVLDRPYRNSGKTVYEWMVESFRTLEAMPAGSREAAEFAEKLRAEIYSTILNTDPGPQFRAQLRAAMAKEFGADFSGGVFVRSDTNVEDLPGFTGAGLNLTVFNVVGFDNIVKAISEVWASPYTPRAWAWRQSHMRGPEHVYPAVLLLKTVPSDISGVMVTQDVDTGDPGVLSVAVNEGVGGAVEGQAAESVRIDRKSGTARLMATATATQADGAAGRGRDREAAGLRSGDTLLTPDEFKQLIAFADEIPKQFPQFGEDGKPVAADVEFAFVNGKLWLLQIRPFNESRAARGATYLIQMDKALERQSQQDGEHARGGPMNRSLRYGKHLGAASRWPRRRPLLRRGPCLSARRLRGDRHPPARRHPPGQPGRGQGRQAAPGCAARPEGRRSAAASARPSTCRRPIPSSRGRSSGILTGSMDDYGLAVLDLTDPAKPRYAEHRGDHRQNVGSVGKLVVVLALFQALADTYPDDVDARKRVLKDTVVTADGFSQSDSHTVRIFDPKTRTLTRRPVQIGDRATLYEWLDWMLSPSSNSAAGMVMREAMLVRQFGTAYPPSEAEIKRFFDETPKSDLTALFDRTFYEPVTRNGLDLAMLRQGSFFTATGKQKVPGVGDSYGTARELMRYLLRMEQGRIVDVWSSREIKRLLYVTERRIRYASSPALADAAVYFKSGSLFECAQEPGFTCRPYAGNVKNYMNSTAIIESPAAGRKLYYMSTLVTNILRKNSAAEHQALATRLQQLIATDSRLALSTRPRLHSLRGNDEIVQRRGESHQPIAAVR